MSLETFTCRTNKVTDADSVRAEAIYEGGLVAWLACLRHGVPFCSQAGSFSQRRSPRLEVRSYIFQLINASSRYECSQSESLRLSLPFAFLPTATPELLLMILSSEESAHLLFVLPFSSSYRFLKLLNWCKSTALSFQKSNSFSCPDGPSHDHEHEPRSRLQLLSIS